jgi:hypothetical protein
MTESAFIESLARMLVKRVIAPEPGCADARAEVRKVQGKRAARAREDENPMHAQYRVLNRAAGMIVARALADRPGAEFKEEVNWLVAKLTEATLRHAHAATGAGSKALPWIARLQDRVVEAALELEVL